MKTRIVLALLILFSASCTQTEERISVEKKSAIDGQITDKSKPCGDELIQFAKEEVSKHSEFMDTFAVKLDAADIEHPAPVQRFEIELEANAHYRFCVFDASDSNTKAIIRLFDSKNREWGATFNEKSKTHYPYFDFICTCAGTYEVYMSIEGGKAGCAVGTLSLVVRTKPKE